MKLDKIIDISKSFEISQDIIENREKGRLEFISKFPLNSIKTLSIDEYVQGTDENSFCYWLEFKKILFGVGGGNASKFGLYKAKNGNYYNNYGKNKKNLSGKKLDSFFTTLKSGIIKALEYTQKDEIEKIKDIKIPLWNMILQKILTIYYPDKFLTIGAPDVIVECARDIGLRNIKLDKSNSIEINYKCKQKLSNSKEFKDWSYEKIGSLIWETYKDEVKRNYYILGSKYGENNKTIKFPLNQILYGPPGTGKTYHTILKAAQIVENRMDITYSEAQKIFNDNLHNQIEFITFHQNYSYEDFIQGLRPDIDNKSSLVFDRIDGVFKKISDKALENLKLSKKEPEELSKEALFESAIEKFKDIFLENEKDYKINETAYIFDLEEDAFRYTGKNWLNHANGLRMKFSDLKEFYRNGVKNRKDVKKLLSISGLANQHATYYFMVYEKILELIPKKSISPMKVTKKNFVIIIDEINRANISRVFGELITLIEPDKRFSGKIALSAKLPSGENFIVPSNLFIIGTMNTADKSIALLDIALRRRFTFIAMYPKYSLNDGIINHSEILRNLNNRILKTKGHDFQIGHSYFMGENNDLLNIMNNKVIPLLLEYYMNDKKEVVEILKESLSGTEFVVDEECWPLKIKGKND